MGKITGRETRAELPAKVTALYEAILELIEEGADIVELKVSEITEKAGIGKGTAYDYFDTKEEMIAYALLFFINHFMLSVETRVMEKASIWDKVDLTLDIMRTEIGKSACMLRFINLLYEPSQTGQMLREAMREMKTADGCCPLLTLQGTLSKSVAQGEIRGDVPIDFLLYSLVSRFISYAAFLLREREDPLCASHGSDVQEKFQDYIRACIREEFQSRAG